MVWTNGGSAHTSNRAATGRTRDTPQMAMRKRGNAVKGVCLTACFESGSGAVSHGKPGPR